MSAADALRLIDLSANSRPFLDLLPADWREELVALWPTYASTSTVLGLQLDACLIGGGVLFRQPTPDTLGYADLARSLFARGLLYIGYLWIAPAQRGHDYGGAWLDAVRQRFPGCGFWLAIEDAGLRRFYQRHGFEVIQAHTSNDHTEWIMTDNIRTA